MKTLLFLSLVFPGSAFASYSCHTFDPTHNGLGVNEQDPAHIVVFYNHSAWQAVVTKDEGGPFGTKVYALKNPLSSGTLTLTEMPGYTRAGQVFCGRAGCPEPKPLPHQPTHSRISATLVLDNDQPVKFSCNETLP